MLGKIVKRAIYTLIATRVNIPLIVVNMFQELYDLKQLLEALDINCVFDVGANTGQTVEKLRGIGYREHIFSFEPVKMAFESLEKSHSHDPLWKGFNIALGAESTEMAINVLPQSTVMSSLLDPIHRPDEMRRDTIQVRRLDEIFESLVEQINEPRIFLKMDTQGYDMQVFEGAAGCIKQILALQSEISAQTIYTGQPRYVNMLQYYENAGYELFALSEASRTQAGLLEDINCLMQRQSQKSESI